MTNTLSSVVLGLGFSLPGPAASTDSVAAGKSNIVFMLADDLGYGELGWYGGGILRCSDGTCSALDWCGPAAGVVR